MKSILEFTIILRLSHFHCEYLGDWCVRNISKCIFGYAKPPVSTVEVNFCVCFHLLITFLYSISISRKDGLYNSECNTIQSRIKKFSSKWHNQFIHLLCCFFPFQWCPSVWRSFYILLSCSFRLHLFSSAFVVVVVVVVRRNLWIAAISRKHFNKFQLSLEEKSNQVKFDSLHLIWFDVISC